MKIIVSDVQMAAAEMIVESFNLTVDDLQDLIADDPEIARLFNSAKHGKLAEISEDKLKLSSDVAIKCIQEMSNSAVEKLATKEADNRTHMVMVSAAKIVVESLGSTLTKDKFEEIITNHEEIAGLVELSLQPTSTAPSELANSDITEIAAKFILDLPDAVIRKFSTDEEIIHARTIIKKAIERSKEFNSSPKTIHNKVNTHGEIKDEL